MFGTLSNCNDGFNLLCFARWDTTLCYRYYLGLVWGICKSLVTNCRGCFHCIGDWTGFLVTNGATPMVGENIYRMAPDHYNDVIMSSMASQISFMIVYSTVYSSAAKIHQSYPLLALCAWNSPVTLLFTFTQRPVTESFAISLICAWTNCSIWKTSSSELGYLSYTLPETQNYVETWLMVSVYFITKRMNQQDIFLHSYWHGSTWLMIERTIPYRYNFCLLSSKCLVGNANNFEKVASDCFGGIGKFWSDIVLQ